MKPVLVVLSAGQSEYREAMLARIARRYRLMLVSPEPVTWEIRHVIDHVVVDPSDAEGFVAAALRFADEYPVDGVFTYDEWCIEMVATIGALLGVPHCERQAAAGCRDKWASRELWREKGVPSATSELVWNVEDALRAASRIGYPVVVKPRALSASFGVSRAWGPDEVSAMVDRAGSIEPKRAWAHEYGVLIEEYLDGDEISVDSAVCGDQVNSAVFAKKVLGYAPSFEEVGHIVGAPEKIVPDPERVREVVRAAHEALGVTSTVTHTELRLTASGPRIVEVNGRLGGGLIPDLGVLATGVDMAVAAADIAAGRSPNLSATHDLVAGIRFFYADASGTVESCDLDPQVASAPWIRRVQWLVEAGSEIRAEPGRRYFARVGFAIVVAESVQECEARMEALASHVSVRVGPAHGELRPLGPVSMG